MIRSRRSHYYLGFWGQSWGGVDQKESGSWSDTTFNGGFPRDCHQLALKRLHVYDVTWSVMAPRLTPRTTEESGVFFSPRTFLSIPKSLLPRRKELVAVMEIASPSCSWPAGSPWQPLSFANVMETTEATPIFRLESLPVKALLSGGWLEGPQHQAFQAAQCQHNRRCLSCHAWWWMEDGGAYFLYFYSVA